MVTIPTLLSAPPEQTFIVAGFGLASLVVQKFFRLLIDRQRQVHERLIEKHRQKAAEALGGLGVEVTLSSDGSINISSHSISPKKEGTSKNAEVLPLPLTLPEDKL